VPLILVLILLGGVFIAAFRARTQRVASDMEALKRILYQQRQALQREMNSSDSDAQEYDSLNAQAQREIQRLSGRLEGYGLNAPVSPDGRVHLRGGGSISPEQWERTRGTLTAPPLRSE
jgi:hypothetical protein